MSLRRPLSSPTHIRLVAEVDNLSQSVQTAFQSQRTDVSLGSGNMATHSSAEEKRAAQDVEAPAHHQSKPEGTYHWGRGGEGNMMTIGKNGKEEKKERTPSTENNGRSSGSFHDAFEKGKEMLGLKKVEKDKAANGSAIADD